MDNKCFQFSVIPAVRISSMVRPEVRFYGVNADMVKLAVLQDGKALREFHYPLESGVTKYLRPDFAGLCGDVVLHISFWHNMTLLYAEDYPYQVIESGVPSTQLIDGCWISIYHWSDDEARWFNNGLKTMGDEDFKQHIRDMAAVGIRGVVIQNLFDSRAYVGGPPMTADGYSGKAYYPSALYENRMDIAAHDPIEAVLAAADECGIHVFLGIGLYAWFDFTAESLKWHIRVAQEVYQKYGGHKSFYGWYVSEEIFGDLYFSHPTVEDEEWKKMPVFFRDFTAAIRKLTPTKPVALAPNNIKFHEREAEWKEILPYIDVLIPFAFARDLEHLNVLDIKRICEE
ncbi:MAG: DUF4434 domain-containing protein, partial [Angelakisella sp.]